MRPTYVTNVLRFRPDIRSGLLAWFPLGDETIYDWSGWGNNSTAVTGVKTTLGFRGQMASNFVRANSTFINFSARTTTQLSLNGTFSASFWFNTTDNGGGDALFANSDGGTNTSYVIGLGQVTLGKLDLWNDASGAGIITTAGTWNDGNWHHVVVTRTGSAGSWTITWYVDGKKENSGTSATNPNATGAQFAIGRFGSFNGRYYQGNLQDVRIYNRLLSEQEANTIYNTGPEGIDAMILNPALISTAHFRRTMSELGTRMGSRQRWVG